MTSHETLCLLKGQGGFFFFVGMSYSVEEILHGYHGVYAEESQFLCQFQLHEGRFSLISEAGPQDRMDIYIIRRLTYNPWL